MMAHFAQIDKNNVVTQVLVVDNNQLLINGIESEQAGIDFLASLGLGSNWIQTSYNNSFRNRFAAIGDIYSKERDIFTQPEMPDQDFESPWFGIKHPSSPSIMLDSAPRSANRWFNAAVRQAFPQAFQRWGYLHQHNADTYKNSAGFFEVLATTVRNPLDSLASNLVTFNVVDDDHILREIQATSKILQAILENKTNVKIFKFEDVTDNIESVLLEIGLSLGITPEPFDKDALNEQLKSEVAGFYSIPQDNKEDLEIAKAKLSEPQFSDAMKLCADLYEKVINEAKII